MISNRTVLFLRTKDKILLVFKKRGFGKGYWVGIGGKIEQGEIPENAAIREFKEETCVSVGKVNYLGYLDFYFPHIKDRSWDMRGYIFVCEKWEGELKNSDEVDLKWFNIDAIPYRKMWDDAQYWLPKILKGFKVKGKFIFDKKSKVVEYNIKDYD